MDGPEFAGPGANVVSTSGAGLVLGGEEAATAVKAGESLLEDGNVDFANSEGMLGENGTKVASKSFRVGNDNEYRIDVENPAPGVRPGQIHLHTPDGGKYLYDLKTNTFEGVSKTMAKRLWKIPGFKDELIKAIKYLVGK